MIGHRISLSSRPGSWPSWRRFLPAASPSSTATPRPGSRSRSLAGRENSLLGHTCPKTTGIEVVNHIVLTKMIAVSVMQLVHIQFN